MCTVCGRAYHREAQADYFVSVVVGTCESIFCVGSLDCASVAVALDGPTEAAHLARVAMRRRRDIEHNRGLLARVERSRLR